MRRTSRLLATIGLLTMVIGSVLLATNVTIASAATTTLSLSSTAAGVTCDNTNTSAPVCTGVAAGDVVAASGTGFDKGALASIEECNDITSQPVTLFLGADIPVSCTPISITSIDARPERWRAPRPSYRG